MHEMELLRLDWLFVKVYSLVQNFHLFVNQLTIIWFALVWIKKWKIMATLILRATNIVYYLGEESLNKFSFWSIITVADIDLD